MPESLFPGKEKGAKGFVSEKSKGRTGTSVAHAVSGRHSVDADSQALEKTDSPFSASCRTLFVPRLEGDGGTLDWKASAGDAFCAGRLFHRRQTLENREGKGRFARGEGILLRGGEGCDPASEYLVHLFEYRGSCRGDLCSVGDGALLEFP